MNSDLNWYEEKCECLLKIPSLSNWVTQLLKYSPGEEEHVGSWKMMSFRSTEFEGPCRCS